MSLTDISKMPARVKCVVLGWHTMEEFLGKEIPGEVESLLFCVQTGIGVGIIAFCMGRLVERKKWQNDNH